MSAAHVILYHFVEAFRRAKDYEGLIAQHASPLDGAIEQLGRRIYVLKQACLGFRSACETEGRVVFSADDTERDRVLLPKSNRWVACAVSILILWTCYFPPHIIIVLIDLASRTFHPHPFEDTRFPIPRWGASIEVSLAVYMRRDERSYLILGPINGLRISVSQGAWRLLTS